MSALNALLNMDEKGDNVIGMDDEADTSQSKIADSPVARVSLKEKLEVMKAKVGNENAKDVIAQKTKDKTETL